MHTCREIEKLLDPYTDGELDQPLRLRVEAHLQGCALCSRLAYSKADEAQLIRSGDPVPELSAGFTAQVMANLTRSSSRARGDSFFSLKRLSARPWLAPALAGLIILVTVSWAVSSRLLPASTGKVAFQDSSTVGQAVQIPGTPAAAGNNIPERQEAIAPGISQAHKPENTLGADIKELNINEGSAGTKGTNGETTYGPESSRAITPSPQENRETSAAASSSGRGLFTTMAPQTTGAMPQELEQQGTPVFEPTYLPAGYSLAPSSPLSPVPGNSSAGGAGTIVPQPGQGSLQLTYHNAQTGGWITLEIQLLNSPTQQPVTPPAKTGEDSTSGAAASVNATGSQPTGADQITWQAQKNGASFTLTVTGSLSDQELKRVAASVR